MKKAIIISLLSLVLVTAIGGASVLKVHADNTNKPLPSMIQGLIEKYNLNEDEVIQYVDGQREQMQAERRQDVEEKLNDAVSEGKITEEQKASLLEKMAELQGEGPEHRGELREWAQENGIDISQLGLGRFGHRANKAGFGGNSKFGQN